MSTTEIQMPEIGQRVYPLPKNGDWFGIGEFYRDKIGVVSAVHPEASIPYVTAEFQSQQKPDDTVRWSFYCWKTADVLETDIVPVVYTQGEIDSLNQQINDLTRDRDRWREVADERARTIERGKDTHRDLGKRLLDEAENRGWCSEFDEFVNDYNADCPSGWEIEERIKLIETRVRIEGTVYKDVTVWVKDGEDATDPDNWYSENSTDSEMSDPQEFIDEQLDGEKDENGWDDTSVKLRY